MKEQILNLLKQKKTYSEICKILGCDKSTIYYHRYAYVRELKKIRMRLKREVQHPFARKIESFCSEQYSENSHAKKKYNKRLIYFKIRHFFKDRKSKIDMKPTFTVDDVITKIGPNPKCYITGEPIDINEVKTYAFDHIIPVSRGGENSIENLGLCTTRANWSKSDMTPEELIEFCKKVLKNNGYECSKSSTKTSP